MRRTIVALLVLVALVVVLVLVVDSYTSRTVLLVQLTMVVPLVLLSLLILTGSVNPVLILTNETLPTAFLLFKPNTSDHKNNFQLQKSHVLKVTRRF